MSKQGVDYSWARPGGAALKAAGKQFAVRYIPYQGAGGKGLDSAEFADLRANGLDVAMVFESYAARALEGHGAGVADAQASVAALKALGMGDLPIYFAVDFDAAENQQPAIDDYLKGAAEVIGLGRVGVYAGYWIIKRCKENNTATYLWQTYAWSGGNVHPDIHLYQYKNGQNINGAVDFNESRKDNFGQLAATGAAPTPAPAPSTPQPVSGTYTVKAGDVLSAIAAKFGTNYQTLAVINGLPDPNRIYPGQVLRLTAATPAPAAPVQGGHYTVVKDDTLSGIGSKLGVDWHSIASANNLSSPFVIYPGQVLVVPGSGASPAPAAGRTYTVVSGDNLSGIAAKFGMTYQVLAGYNGIANPDRIYPGQVIRIP